MKVRFFASPVHAPEYLFDVDEPVTIDRLLDLAAAPDWFRDFGVVRIGGEVMPRELWSIAKLKPESPGYCDLCVVPRRRNILPLLLTVATVALAASISGGLLGPGALGLGATFASGGTGAYLAAAAVSVGGQLLSSALTAPPASGQGKSAERSVIEAGIRTNPANLFETLPVLFGKMHFSPPQLMQGYTEYIDGEVWLNAAVGLEGRCLIENVKINGLPVAEIPRATVETREGAAGDTAPAMCGKTVAQKTLSNVLLSNFLTLDLAAFRDQLKDQTNPDNSMPSWHRFDTAGTWDEFHIRLSAPSGMVRTDSGADAFVPIRIEARKKGDATWRKFPTVHLQDTKSATGPIKAELKFKRQEYPSGIHYSFSGTQWPVADLTGTTGYSTGFVYQADSYFRVPVTFSSIQAYTAFSGYTNGPLTVSASSEFSGATPAWRAFDYSISSRWRPLLNSLPATLTVACSPGQTIKSYRIISYAETTAPMAWQVEGYNGTSWILLDSYVRSGMTLAELDADDGCDRNLSPSAAYQQYRWTFTANNGAANQTLEVAMLQLFTVPSLGLLLEAEPSGSAAKGVAAYTTSGLTEARCTNAEVTPDGATFYLHPAEWPEGEYEFRVKRGVGAERSAFRPVSYSYDGSGTNADFFERRLFGGKHIVYVGQNRFRTEVMVESVSTVEYDVSPFNHSGLALITLRVPGLQVESISADFTSYGRIWNGSAWASSETPTRNPAALYRDVLRGRANAQPVDDEIIDNADFVAWYNRCVANGYQTNFVAQGQTVESVLQTIASTGFAAPRHSNVEGIVEDYDTSALPIELNLTPLNSRDTGTSIVYPRTVHAIIVEYAVETDEYKTKQSYVYLDGYSSSNAEIFETWQLPGFTAEAKATARAEFDIQQSRLRASRYNFEIGVEAYKLRRGSVVGITSDVLNHKNSFGIIKTVTRSGGNIVSIQLDNIIPWSVSAEASETMGVAIQLADGTTTMVKTVAETTDNDTCTFSTPFADTGVVVPGLMVATGVAGKEFRRCKVMSITPKTGSEWAVELADERPELFA